MAAQGIDGENSWYNKYAVWCAKTSILGSIFITLYTTPLGDICRKHNFNYLMYGDDTQWYNAFKPSITTINECNMYHLHVCIDKM